MELSGTFANRYQIQRVLGAGTMGKVYLADDTQRGEQVAIKTVQAAQFPDEEARLRFHREAKITTALSHPNVIRVIDHGQHEGRVYIAYEFVDGGGLGDRLREHGPLPPSLFFPIAVAVLDAVAHAHMHGVLHRDIKADNIFLDRELSPRVGDFGLAKGIDDLGLKTVAGTVMGTPSYIAPELARGQQATESTDQYALGVLLYMMLGGRPPFVAPGLFDLMMMHLEQAPPPLREFRPDVPPGLALAIQRALRKVPGERWPDIPTFRDAINSLSPSVEAPWRPATPEEIEAAGSVEAKRLADEQQKAEAARQAELAAKQAEEAAAAAAAQAAAEAERATQAAQEAALRAAAEAATRAAQASASRPGTPAGPGPAATSSKPAAPVKAAHPSHPPTAAAAAQRHRWMLRLIIAVLLVNVLLAAWRQSHTPRPPSRDHGPDGEPRPPG